MASPVQGQVPHVLMRCAITKGQPFAKIVARLDGTPLAQLFLFVGPTADFDHVVAEAARAYPDIPTVACTTAGEIGPMGYAEDTIIAVGLPDRDFATSVILAPSLDRLHGHGLTDRVVQARVELTGRRPGFPTAFAFAMIDGLSRREDAVLSQIAPALGPLPLFGGSAGDGRAFGRTKLGLNGTVHDNAAILSLVTTACRAQVFSLDHMTPTPTRMVVTAADPETRCVKQINGAPAASEYARLIGTDPAQLDTFTFASHPVVVRLGDTHHVRAIQRVTPGGDLVFFSAIEEGMVLSVARSSDMAGHLHRELAGLGRHGPPADILGCDCILRRIEAEQSQQSHRVSEILARHRVVGFSTYGEQIGPMHVNHTMTGVALYPPPHTADPA
ncbi:FIST N-terminal domain-containing protein [Palleronia abyssalis]|uniref:GfdT protein n=1 Tax=Palleronia abyssalis TaxID=1501240 RepID=A0A2R8BV24_9RHOB|nr:FIST N-terminal domain-containing protein [Palleronia abyssalis]SPJ24017.1 hypothetical protein PAA8504_01839 [Palleronia abyssalis]